MSNGFFLSRTASKFRETKYLLLLVLLTTPALPQPNDPRIVDWRAKQYERLVDLYRAGHVQTVREALRLMVHDGYAPAARLLGTTYDPAFLPKDSPYANVIFAREWYIRAMQLGDYSCLNLIRNLPPE